MVIYQLEKTPPITQQKAQTLAFALSFMLILGSFGALWIDDEFSTERMMIFAGVIPTSLWLMGILIWNPRIIDRKLRYQLFYNLFTLCIGVHLWGVALLINALPSRSTSKVVVSKVFKADLKDRSLSVAMKRGNFGWFYRTRW